MQSWVPSKQAYFDKQLPYWPEWFQVESTIKKPNIKGTTFAKEIIWLMKELGLFKKVISEFFYIFSSYYII